VTDDVSDALKAILENDHEGIFSPKNPTSLSNAQGKHIRGFLEINDFIAAHDHEPSRSSKDPKESKLGSRLEHIRNNEERRLKLLEYDIHYLLPESQPSSVIGLEKQAPPIEVEEVHVPLEDALTPLINELPPTLEELLEDSFWDMEPVEQEIFQLTHVSKHPKRFDRPEYVAQRRRCMDFPKFELLFMNCRTDLHEGRRQYQAFKTEKIIAPGAFFLVDNELVYVADLIEKGRDQARLRCIYENRTESDLLRRSLAKSMYHTGKVVTELYGGSLDAETAFGPVDGVVYVLRSLSTDPEIAHVEHLCKIGFTRGNILNRISSAERSATYLHAPVKLLREYECHRVNPQKLEKLLHRFFYTVSWHAEVPTAPGQIAEVHEWFIIPLEIIDEAVARIEDGTLVGMVYNPQLQKIMPGQ
jgi:hypothetical protein